MQIFNQHLLGVIGANQIWSSVKHENTEVTKYAFFFLIARYHRRKPHFGREWTLILSNPLHP